MTEPSVRRCYFSPQTEEMTSRIVTSAAQQTAYSRGLGYPVLGVYRQECVRALHRLACSDFGKASQTLKTLLDDYHFAGKVIVRGLAFTANETTLDPLFYSKLWVNRKIREACEGVGFTFLDTLMPDHAIHFDDDMKGLSPIGFHYALKGLYLQLSREVPWLRHTFDAAAIQEDLDQPFFHHMTPGARYNGFPTFRPTFQGIRLGPGLYSSADVKTLYVGDDAATPLVDPAGHRLHTSLQALPAVAPGMLITELVGVIYDVIHEARCPDLSKVDLIIASPGFAELDLVHDAQTLLSCYDSMTYDQLRTVRTYDEVADLCHLRILD